jgi:uncharacterized protein (TIGR02996 family)
VTTEDDFHRALDANPNDHQTRLVFADWLQDRDDPRADGYRALGVVRVCPYAEGTGGLWRGYGRTDITNNPVAAPGGYAAGALLPPDWFALVRDGNKYPNWKPDWWAYWHTRREAEDAAALAFTELPAPRRAQLLAPGRAS